MMKLNWFSFFKSGVVTIVFLTGIIKYINSKRQNRKSHGKALGECKKSENYEKIINSPDSDWKKVGSVKELWLYPLKSGKGFSVKTGFFGISGLTAYFSETDSTLKDRFLIVCQKKADDTKAFVTARQHPKLQLIEVIPVDQRKVKLRAEGMDDLVIDTFKCNEIKLEDQVTMWFKEIVYYSPCDDNSNKWISRYLTGKEDGLISLGVSSPTKRRKVDIDAWKKHAEKCENLRSSDMGLFSDLASYMLLSQSSVDDLNNRLHKNGKEDSKNTKPLQFRPNIVIDGCEPYAEDNWEYIKIGKNKTIIRQFKQVPRCTMVNIDPDTGKRNPLNEPLVTLKKYRNNKDPELAELDDYAPCLGIYCGLINAGNVNVEDDVFVYKPQNKFYHR